MMTCMPEHGSLFLEKPFLTKSKMIQAYPAHVECDPTNSELCRTPGRERVSSPKFFPEILCRNGYPSQKSNVETCLEHLYSNRSNSWITKMVRVIIQSQIVMTTTDFELLISLSMLYGTHMYH